jgi:hypothetical protein
MCPPAELFLVVVTIKPARDNSAIDKMTKATSTSTKVKPFDFLNRLKDYPPDKGFDFKKGGCKTYTNGFLNLALQRIKRIV